MKYRFDGSFALSAAIAMALCLAPRPAVAGGPERVERGQLVIEGVPATPPEVKDAIARYQNTRSALLAGFDASGEGVFISTRFGETAQVHHVSTPMGARRQMTFFAEPTAGVAPSPVDGGVVAFLKDSGGDENFQVYAFDLADGVERILSDGEGRKTDLVWPRDGRRLAWQKTMEGATRGVVIADLDATDARRTVFTGEGFWAPVDFSPDGESLILANYVSVNESYLHILDLLSGETTQINPSSVKIAYGDATFSADGKSVYFTADEGGEFLDLYRFDVAKGEKRNLTADIDWGVEDFVVAARGGFYAFTVNEAGRSTLRLRRDADDRAVRLPAVPAGVVYGLSFSPDGRRIGFTLDASDSPGDVYTIATNGRGDLVRWTASQVGGLDASRFADPAFFDYPTFDEVGGVQRRIPAFIYRPAGEGPFPVVVSIHGGPEGQARPAFSSTYQQWVNELGAAVIVPNVRGSDGYGKSYLLLDNGAKREDSVRDIGALLDWIADQPDLDASRVVVYGGSYGGYMVLASLTNYNDRLAGGVDIVGISNFVTFLENTSDYRRDLRRAEYGDERDPEMRDYLEKISPLNNVARITKPLLVVQGLNDPRVPASEAEQILAAVRANGGEAWYLAAKDEGHGFRKKTIATP